MLISVIIPNYKHAKYLGLRIDSVLNQTYTGFEVIILDDCSPDNSKDIIEQYRNHPKVSAIIYNTQNSGSTFNQWDKGIEMAKGDWIWIAESDDYAAPEFLQTLVNLIKQHDNLVIACSNAMIIDSDSAPLNLFFGPDNAQFSQDFIMKGHDFLSRYMINSNCVPNASGAIFSKLLFSKISSDYKAFKLNGDWMFWSELLMCGDVGYHAAPLNYFRTHSGNVRSANYINGIFLPEIFRIKEWLCNHLNFNDAQRRTLKYNMLHLLYHVTQFHKGEKVNLSREGLKECMSIVDRVSPGTFFPALKTKLVLSLKKLKGR